MGVPSEKASNARQRIEEAVARLVPAGDGLVKHLADWELEALRAIGRQLTTVADCELQRRSA